MVLIAPRIPATGQSHHLLAHLVTNPAATHSSSVAMHDACCSFLSIAGFPPVHLTLRTLHQARCLRDTQFPSQELIQDHDSLLVLRVQCHCFFHTDIFTELFPPDNITDP